MSIFGGGDVDVPPPKPVPPPPKINRADSSTLISQGVAGKKRQRTTTGTLISNALRSVKSVRRSTLG